VKDKHVIVVGAGPGGLSIAMLLASKGYRVTVYEKEPVVGGRNATLKLGKHRFDTGPTFLMMSFILEELFAESGRDLADYCELKELDPMYKLTFPDKELYSTANKDRMKLEIARLFPGQEKGIDHFYINEEIRYKKMYPCLQEPYGSLWSAFSPKLLRALPHLSLQKSLYQVLGNYFSDDLLKISFTFQAKYLGMSPWECPAAFAIIPYIEHAYGIFHVTGGLSRISEAMDEVAREHGADINLSSPVKKVLVKNGIAHGVQLESGECKEADAVVINADFGYAMNHLFDPRDLKKWSPQKVEKSQFSCSTFMLYLALDKIYDEPHHNIVFASDYKKNINEITVDKRISDDMSLYIRNAQVTDTQLSPDKQSGLYVLVPTPNLKGDDPWDEEHIQWYRDKVLTRIEQKTSMTDIRKHISDEKIITPKQWQRDYNVYQGATFNLGHQINQMLMFRPHNRFEDVRGCYLVGGGTHPGSGLPTIYESARISAKLIENDMVKK